MGAAAGFLTILTIAAAGAIFYTAVSHPEGLKALTGGLDSILKTGYAAELGQVA